MRQQTHIEAVPYAAPKRVIVARLTYPGPSIDGSGGGLTASNAMAAVEVQPHASAAARTVSYPSYQPATLIAVKAAPNVS